MRSRRRDRLPKPLEVERDLADVVTAITGRGSEKPLIDEYRWAYHSSLQPTVADSSKSGATVADDGSVPGSTAAVAAGKEWMRTRVAQAAEKIGRAVSELRSARDDLDSAMHSLSRDTYVPEGRFPRTASRADLAEAHDAQSRRMAAGRGWGEA